MTNEFPIHLMSIIDDEIKIISLCDSIKEMHPCANFWLPVKKIDSFLMYVKLNKISIINSVIQMAPLFNSKVMYQVR